MPPVPQAGSSSFRTVPGLARIVVVIDEKQVHHEADDFARREVVARGFVGQFVEASDEILEEQPHVLVRHLRRMQIDVAEFRNDEVEDVRLAHLLDFVIELEEIEDAADVGREALDVADEVLLDVVGVALQLLEG